MPNEDHKSETLKALEALIKIPPQEKDIIRSFYQETIYKFVQDPKSMKDQIQFVIVGHIVPTLPFYLEALDKIGTVSVIIAKGSIPDENIKAWLKGIKITKRIIKSEEDIDQDLKDNIRVKFQSLSVEEAQSYNLVKNDKKIEISKFGLREYLAIGGISFIEKCCESKRPIIIIDIGGYFAHTIKDIALLEKSNIIGYVEDTENGYQKYRDSLNGLLASNSEVQDENIFKDIVKKIFHKYIDYEAQDKESIDKQMDTLLSNITITEDVKKIAAEDQLERSIPPIISVARSQIKDSEDYNVGKAITDATDHIMRVCNATHIAESKTVLVIGYGKIGSAAARVASEKTRGPVLVCEIDPVRRLKASAHSYKIVSIIEGLKQADIIICCTGKNCLTKEHLQYLRNNVYISSCTSKDDEFDKSFFDAIGKGKDQLAKNLDKEEKKFVSETKGTNATPITNPEENYVTQYIYSGKIIYLLNNGNSVNFVEKAVHGYFIHGVLASLVISAVKIFDNHKKSSKFLQRAFINDFNELYDELDKTQSIIAEILMRNKLRDEPAISNYKNRHARYIDRSMDNKDLEDKLQKSRGVYIQGEKKYGKSQVAEIYYLLNKSKYDIFWKFDKSTLLSIHFKSLAEKINAKIRSGSLALLGQSKIEFIDLEGEVISQVTKFLSEQNFSYLLVFEDIDMRKQYIPEISHRKKGHIIITCTETKCVEFRENMILEENNVLKLEKFPGLELFEFLINDQDYWKTNIENLKKIAWAFANPKSDIKEFEDRKKVTDTKTTEEEIEANDENQYDYVSMLNLAAAFIIDERKIGQEDEKVLQNLLACFANSKSNLNNIGNFLKYIFDELKTGELIILSKFYLLKLNTPFLITKDKLEKPISDVKYENTISKIIERLERFSLIENDNGLYRAYYHGLYNKQICEILEIKLLEIDLKQPTEEEARKIIEPLPDKIRRHSIEDCFKTFIDDRYQDELYIQIVEFLHAYTIYENQGNKKKPVTPSPKKGTNNEEKTFEIYDQKDLEKYLEVMLAKWKDGGKHLHAKAMYEIGRYLENNKDLEEAIIFLQSSIKYYHDKPRKTPKIHNKICKLANPTQSAKLIEQCPSGVQPIGSNPRSTIEIEGHETQDFKISSRIGEREGSDILGNREREGDSEDGNSDQNLKRCEKLYLSRLYVKNNSFYNFKNHIAEVFHKLVLLNKIRDSYVSALALLNNMIVESKKYVKKDFKLLLSDRVNNNQITILPENDHMRDHRSNIYYIMNLITVEQIKAGDIICLERKQYGKNMGMQDVILLAMILEYNSKVEENHLPIPISTQSPLYKDAELYNLAKSKNIKVVGILNTKESSIKSDNLDIERNILYTIQVLFQRGFNSIIMPLGRAHLENIRNTLSDIERMNLSVTNIRERNNLWTDNATQYRSYISKEI